MDGRASADRLAVHEVVRYDRVVPQDESTPKPPPDAGSTWTNKIPTWFGQLRAADVKERQVRDDKADERVDKFAVLALEASQRTVKFQWVIIGVLVLTVIVLAGHAVVVKVTQDGTVNVETTPPAP